MLFQKNIKLFAVFYSFGNVTALARYHILLKEADSHCNSFSFEGSKQDTFGF